MSPGLAFRFVEDAMEKAAVAQLVDDVYGKTYGTRPAIAHAYAVAYRDGNAVGCLGTDRADEDGCFPIERLYRLDRKALPAKFAADTTVQFGRLVATEPAVSPGVVYAGMRHVAACWEARFGLLEHTDPVHRLTARLGLCFLDIPHAPLDLSRVREADRAYYERHRPKPYLIELGASCRNLWARLPEEIRSALPGPE